MKYSLMRVIYLYHLYLILILMRCLTRITIFIKSKAEEIRQTLKYRVAAHKILKNKISDEKLKKYLLWTYLRF